jgi:hypothetical protein
MLNLLLPQPVDNTYRGYKVALWLFGLLVLMKTIISVNSIVNGYSIASSADGIPLDTFAPDAAQTVVSLFGLLGLLTLVLCVLSVVVLVRYRSLVPFMFVLLLLEALGRKLFLQVMPIPRTGDPPGSYVSFVILALMIVGLALSLWKRSAGTRAP